MKKKTVVKKAAAGKKAAELSKKLNTKLAEKPAAPAEKPVVKKGKRTEVDRDMLLQTGLLMRDDIVRSPFVLSDKKNAPMFVAVRRIDRTDTSIGVEARPLIPVKKFSGKPVELKDRISKLATSSGKGLDQWGGVLVSYGEHKFVVGAPDAAEWLDAPSDPNEVAKGTLKSRKAADEDETEDEGAEVVSKGAGVQVVEHWGGKLTDASPLLDAVNETYDAFVEAYDTLDGSTAPRMFIAVKKAANDLAAFLNKK